MQLTIEKDKSENNTEPSVEEEPRVFALQRLAIHPGKMNRRRWHFVGPFISAGLIENVRLRWQRGIGSVSATLTSSLQFPRTYLDPIRICPGPSRDDEGVPKYHDMILAFQNQIRRELAWLTKTSNFYNMYYTCVCVCVCAWLGCWVWAVSPVIPWFSDHGKTTHFFHMACHELLIDAP